MGGAIYANTIDAKFEPKKGGFSYNNETKNDQQAVKQWEITKSSDAPNINRNQIIIAVHNRETNKIQIHVKNSTDIQRMSQNNSITMHQTTINHYMRNETVNPNNLTILTGGAFRDGEFLGRSRTINISDDGYHELNRTASEVHEASKAEMSMLHYVFDTHADSGERSGTFSRAESIGGVELSLKNLGARNLYGFKYNKTDNTLIGLFKTNTNSNHREEDKKSFLQRYLTLFKKTAKSDSDGDHGSILKESDNSAMVWQHFCTFLRMFHGSGDRESVSFSLDPAHKINTNQQNVNVILKKVYYPEILRWSKAGEVMFDADWFLKTLLYDMHPNITKHIPNYQSYIDKVMRNGANRKDNWHRLWIVLDETEEYSEENNLILISKIKFKIKVRKMNVESDGVLYDDDECNNDKQLTEFVNHVNTYMYIIQQRSLFLQRLEAVYCALSLAKFAYINNIPFDIDMIKEVCNKQKQELLDNNITFSLASIQKKAEKCSERNDGNYLIKETKSYSFCGGIDLNIKANAEQSDVKQIQKMFSGINKTGGYGSAGRINTDWANNNEYRFTKVCNVQHNGVTYSAVLFPAILFEKDAHNQKFIKLVIAIIFGWFFIQILCAFAI